MMLATRLVEAPVLDELFKLTKRPRPEDALLALREPGVRDATLAVAQHMRQLAMEEDAVRIAENKALINYRQFYVGSVAIGIVHAGRRSMPYDWWVFAAVNTKPSKKASKYCAEMRIMRAAREVPCGCIGGLTVLGENQPDGKSGILRKTLDPCGDCRECMRHPDNRPRFRRNSLIHTAKPLSQVSYVEELHKMMTAHGESWS